jgi:hypothetical protein
MERADKLTVLNPAARERRATVDTHIVQRVDAVVGAENCEVSAKQRDALRLRSNLVDRCNRMPVLGDSGPGCLCRHGLLVSLVQIVEMSLDGGIMPDTSPAR